MKGHCVTSLTVSVPRFIVAPPGTLSCRRPETERPPVSQRCTERHEFLLLTCRGRQIIVSEGSGQGVFMSAFAWSYLCCSSGPTPCIGIHDIVIIQPSTQQNEVCAHQCLTCVLLERSFHVWLHPPGISFPTLHRRRSSPHEMAHSCGFGTPRLRDTWTCWHSSE